MGAAGIFLKPARPEYFCSCADVVLLLSFNRHAANAIFRRFEYHRSATREGK
jgi:hypothetical protein